MARKLVTIRKVSEILPIEGADLIELAKIDGWQCVVKKGEFKPGDLGVYFEIDSFVDTSKPAFSFLEKNTREWKGRKGAVIKTMRLKGQLSQGLLLPVEPLFSELLTEKSRIPFFPKKRLSVSKLLEKDFTKVLDVLKYEKESEGDEDDTEVNFIRKWMLENLSRDTRKKVFRVINFFVPRKKILKDGKISSFPTFIRRTDEERIQNIWNKVKNEKNNPCTDGRYNVTVKLDGSSFTNYVKDGVYGLCSRNVKLGVTDGSNFSKVALKYNLPEVMPNIASALGFDFALQGELMGPGIQGNRENLDDHDYFIFKIWSITDQRYLKKEEREKVFKVFEKYGVKLRQVPDLGVVDLEEFKTVEDILKFAEGRSLNNLVREGLVFEHISEPFSFKVISNQYLLKKKD